MKNFNMVSRNCLKCKLSSLLLCLIQMGFSLAQELRPMPGVGAAAVSGQKLVKTTDALGGMSFQQHDSSPQPMEIIAARGFIGEEYNIPSRDGAPITLYHIVNPLANPRTLNKYPVLVGHGLSGDATQLMSNSELTKPRRPQIGQITYDQGDVSIPFMLANNNFDVYLIDGRGTNLNNRRMSTELDFGEANRFWNYTLDEQAQYDWPAAIDFVLEQTQMDQLQYVGYSESTFFMFSLLCAQPHYQAKLASLVAIAPVAYLTHLRGSILPLLISSSMAPDQINGNYLPQPISDTVGATLRKLCSNHLVGSTFCNMMAKAMTGQGESSDDPTELFLTAFKSTSRKSLKHFYQLHTQKRFGMYDYGASGNLRQYGQLVPPNYNLANVKLPTIILVRGGTDFLSTPEDQQLLIAQLGTKPYLDIFLPKYNHLDFFVAKRALFEVGIPIAQTMLDILKARSPYGNMFRDSLATVKRFKPIAIKMPSSSRSLEVQSNLLPNLIEGFVQSKDKLTNPRQNPMNFLTNLGNNFGGQLNLPTFGF